ncbi:uncharacterized protein MELLADRAFT_65170 [Melampsora larici-populina 98AG31]|uniref:RING-type domain-containing protein n=1 Tax=Melampsora larici-populina (strain 98AG31 / pathotype 3-4-7) TaxID=747676 RepID=F4RU82_MELLP|nr:uncharacterized protein MELLADRAFT_65170 [Melampsora larici-populina 98AG31]EGG04047.1 hypothetical protein MELLADRAFT_65170 [Melampsora larici-populina 98AG31]
MSQSIPTTTSYSDLLNIIHFIQTILDDQASSSNIPHERLLPSSILHILDAESSILDVEVRDTWVNGELDVWVKATETRSRIINDLEPILKEYGVGLPLVNYLPQRGSPEWFSLYVFVRHTADLSHVVHQNSDLPEEDQDKCPICAGIFQAGDRYIPLSCHASHWLHEACLTELAVYSRDFLCPLCRERPYPG